MAISDITLRAFVLHPVPEEVNYIPLSTSYKSAKPTQAKSDLLAATTVQPYDDDRITNPETEFLATRGISTFEALNGDENSDAFKSAHDLLGADGQRLSCFFCAESTEIAGLGFACDQDFP